MEKKDKTAESKKRTKRSKNCSNQSQLENEKKEMNENAQKYILTFEELSDFLENVQMTKDKLSIVRDYTPNVKGLPNMLENLYDLLPDKAMKHKFTSIRNRIKIQMLEEEIELASNSSQLSVNKNLPV